jgi:hypothetical protein
MYVAGATLFTAACYLALVQVLNANLQEELQALHPSGSLHRRYSLRRRGGGSVPGPGASPNVTPPSRRMSGASYRSESAEWAALVGGAVELSPDAHSMRSARTPDSSPPIDEETAHDYHAMGARIASGAHGERRGDAPSSRLALTAS